MVHFCATNAECAAMNSASESGVAIRGFRKPAARSANPGNLDQSRICRGPCKAVCRFNDYHHHVIFARSKPRGEAKKRGRKCEGTPGQFLTLLDFVVGSAGPKATRGLNTALWRRKRS